MRAGRTSAVWLVAVVANVLVVATAVAPSAGARPATDAATAASASVPRAGGRPWALAGQPCRLLPTASPTALAVAEGCGGVRPGAPVLTPVGQCTLNFLWHGSDGRDYIGTAGHCLLEGTNQSQVVYRPGEGPPARDSAGRRVGEFAYAALDQFSDFALIRLDRGVTASPEICRFGGPSGLDAGTVPGLTPLQHVGQGSLTGTLVPARTQLAVDGRDIRVLTGLGVASPGDSGSPLVGPDGRAVGVVVATGPVLPLLSTGLFVFSVRIAPEMGRAGRAMGLAFDLATAA